MVGMSVVVWLIKGFDESVVDMPEADISSTTSSFMSYLGSSLSRYRYKHFVVMTLTLMKMSRPLELEETILTISTATPSWSMRLSLLVNAREM